MDLIVFDLDGTLLDASSRISDYTRETLDLLRRRGIHYTVATGRALHASRDVLDGHAFSLPHAYKNGVLIWRPDLEAYSHHHHMTAVEIEHITDAALSAGVTPFLSTLEQGRHHGIYHPPLQSESDRGLAAHFASRQGVHVAPLSEMPAGAEITSISSLGPPPAIDLLETLAADEDDLVAFAGTAIEDAEFKWIDIHHHTGTKGNAVDILRQELGAERVLCFGDNHNDLSMFETADEAYAPSNAEPEIRAAATAVIGHHDEDGIARFLRERFEL